MKHTGFRLLIFLICCGLLLAAFVHIGWNVLASYPVVNEVETSIQGYVLTQNEQVLPVEISITGEFSDYFINDRADDQYLVDIQIGQYTCSDIHWVLAEKDYEMSSTHYEDHHFLIAHDLTMLLISTDYSLIDPAYPSTPCLVVCPAGSREDALALLQDLDDRDLPESWNHIWEDYLP